MRCTSHLSTLAAVLAAVASLAAAPAIGAQEQEAEKPIYENQRAWVFLVPETVSNSAQERVSRRILHTLTEKAFTEALSKIAPPVISKLGGFVVSFINEIPSVGNPTRVKACLLINNAVADEAHVRQDVLPVILFNYSDTFNSGVEFELQRRSRFGRSETISRHHLLRDSEMVTLNRLGRVDSLFMVIPKRAVRFDAPGNYQLAITARSRDGRTTHQITVRDSQSTSAVTSIARVDSL